MNKFNAKRTTIDLIVFDSIRESARYCELKLLEQAGEISGLEVHRVFVIQEAFEYQGKKIRPITYEADFVYMDAHRTIVEDVKGVQTPEFKLKWKLMKFKYPNVDFRIID